MDEFSRRGVTGFYEKTMEMDRCFSIGGAFADCNWNYAACSKDG